MTRRVAFAAAFVVTLAIGAAVVWSLLERQTVTWFWDQGDRIVVEYSTGSGDVVVWERLRENDTQVVVDIRALTLPPGVPRNAMALENVVAFDLDAPLGDREVVGPDGEAVTQATGAAPTLP